MTQPTSSTNSWTAKQICRSQNTPPTAGCTDLIFGLFDLVGLIFSPRLRNIANQRLHRLGPILDAPTVETLLGHRLNTDLITQHWDDMIRTAASLKSGDVTASLLVSRLRAGARRNQLTRAIQELGRAAKTRFLLAYLEDQTNQALCLNLVTNAVICWNTVYIAAAIDLLRNDGRSTPTMTSAGYHPHSATTSTPTGATPSTSNNPPAPSGHSTTPNTRTTLSVGFCTVDVSTRNSTMCPLRR